MTRLARHVADVPTFTWREPGTDGRIDGNPVGVYVRTEDDDPEPYVDMARAGAPGVSLTPEYAEALARQLLIAAGYARAAKVPPETDQERTNLILTSEVGEPTPTVRTYAERVEEVRAQNRALAVELAVDTQPPHEAV